MNKTITLHLETIPVSVNKLYRRGTRVFKHSSAKERHEDMQWEMSSKYRGKPLTSRLAVYVKVTFPDRRRRDLDNSMKQIGDAGNGIIWEDDYQIDEWHVYRGIGMPGIELRVTELSPD